MARQGYISIDPNGGVFPNGSSDIMYSVLINTSSKTTTEWLLENNATPTKPGFLLKGFDAYVYNYSGDAVYKGVLSLDGIPYSYASIGGQAESRIIAIWEALAPVITFDANSGTFPTSGESQTTYNSTELTGSTALSSIVETPTKPGYVFKGWSTTSTGSVQYTQASMPTISSDTTLYAIYEPDTTKVLLEKGAVDIILGKLK